MKKILVCDDDIILLKVIQHLFKDDGLEVITVNNGGDVLSAAKKHEPSLILLDLMMPKKSGLDVLDELKSDKLLSNIPVVIMSAIENKERMSAAFKKGGIDYIIKPFNSIKMHEKVLKYL
jgi:CheY-like chemotaxis protein